MVMNVGRPGRMLPWTGTSGARATRYGCASLASECAPWMVRACGYGAGLVPRNENLGASAGATGRSTGAVVGLTPRKAKPFARVVAVPDTKSVGMLERARWRRHTRDSFGTLRDMHM